MKTFAILVGYILLFGGLGAALYTRYTSFTRDDDDPLEKYFLEISFAGVLAAVIGLIILALNGEYVEIFGAR